MPAVWKHHPVLLWESASLDILIAPPRCLYGAYKYLVNHLLFCQAGVKVAALPITEANMHLLQSGYSRRHPGEFENLTR